MAKATLNEAWRTLGLSEVSPTFSVSSEYDIEDFEQGETDEATIKAAYRQLAVGYSLHYAFTPRLKVT